MKHQTRLITLACLGIVSSLASAQGLIVQLRHPIKASAVAQRTGVDLMDQTADGPFVLYGLRAGDTIHDAQARLQLDPEVVWAEDDAEVVMPESTGGGKGSTIAAIADREALYTENSGMLSQISWQRSVAFSQGREVRLAILDTGLSPHQPRLWNKAVASANFVENKKAYDVPRGQDTNGNGEVDEAVGHGTMIAGIVDQIAVRVRLVVVRVADSDGVATAWRLVKGLAFARANNAEVVNISLGSLDRIPALTDVLDWCEARGVLVVSGIGNDGTRLAQSPSSISKVVCVAGVDNSDVKPAFSNWEGDADICAPATGIKSTWWDGTMGVWSGTSFASPLVAASLADSLRFGTAQAPFKLRRLCRDSGDDIDSLNPSFKGELGVRLNFRRMHQQFGAL